MKLYGSVTNRLMENSKSPVPVVGMGITQCFHSDRHAFEVIEVKDNTHITVRRMKATRSDSNGMSDCQDWTLESNPEGTVYHLVYRYGHWRTRLTKYVIEQDAEGNPIVNTPEEQHRTGEYYKGKTVLTQKLHNLRGYGWHLGHASEYYDFSF